MFTHTQVAHVNTHYSVYKALTGNVRRSLHPSPHPYVPSLNSPWSTAWMWTCSNLRTRWDSTAARSRAALSLNIICYLIFGLNVWIQTQVAAGHLLQRTGDRKDLLAPHTYKKGFLSQTHSVGYLCQVWPSKIRKHKNITISWRALWLFLDATLECTLMTKSGVQNC